MSDFRIRKHPILETAASAEIPFYWEKQILSAHEGEMISAALFANGIRIFGRHPKDGSPQGIFCANGQCAQCLVIADGLPVKACMTPLQAGMRVEPLHGLPELPMLNRTEAFHDNPVIDIPVLIIGGGPAGLSAASQLGQHAVATILVDDKPKLGGKLLLQTHRFFGSINAVYAGTRGIEIAARLENELHDYPQIDLWQNSTALAVFSDRTVGILREGRYYALVRPQVLLVAAGAREKFLSFKGNTLPGVYGAGAFQTLVNRDLVKAANRLFIVGGGNVGLIAGYHALQAGIQVVGLVEALPECGGYKVHKDKLVRMGVPVYTSSTIVSANGTDNVESITIARVDGQFQPIPLTERTFACDTILIAVGLDPVDEFTKKAMTYGFNVLAAGDAEEIAEASSAMFSGKIKGLQVAHQLGATSAPVPDEWHTTAQILKSHPGAVQPQVVVQNSTGIFPVFHCSQEIPCNPCTSVCPQSLIHIPDEDIRQVPQFLGKYLQRDCIGCEKCVTICPGLAITLVDYRKDDLFPTVTLAHEFMPDHIRQGDQVEAMDVNGELLGEVQVISARLIQRNNHTTMVKLKAPAVYAPRIAGIHIQEAWVSEAQPEVLEHLEEDTIICRCERVTATEIREVIRSGVRDMNAIKSITRAGMGACGSKTCNNLILRMFREEGIALEEVSAQTRRPLFVEVPLYIFTGLDQEKK